MIRSQLFQSFQITTWELRGQRKTNINNKESNESRSVYHFTNSSVEGYILDHSASLESQESLGTTMHRLYNCNLRRSK